MCNELTNQQVSKVPSAVDVVVIGGGPSGSMAAGLLAQKGYDVVILEKAAHPRPTVGESILPHVWPYCDSLGNATQRITDAGFIRKAGGIVKWGDSIRRTRFKEFGHDRPPLHVDRELFDSILLDTARECGVRVFEKHSVRSVDLTDLNQKKVVYRSLANESESTITARYVVDASGQNAMVAKQYGFREFDKDLRFSAIWGYYRGGDYLDYSGEFRPFSDRFHHHPVTFVESVGEWGWTWHIVLRNSVSVGMILPRRQMEAFKRAPGSISKKFQDAVARTQGLGRLLGTAEYCGEKVNVVRDYAYKPTRLAVDGCYLVGDAAAFVDPINSAGVTFGMYGATLAAWAIDMSLRNPHKTQHYQGAFEHQYRQRLNIFRLVALPSNVRLTGDEMDEFCTALRFFSDREKQLALTTTILTYRSQRVHSLLQRLKVSPSAIFDDMPLLSSLFQQEQAVNA